MHIPDADTVGFIVDELSDANRNDLLLRLDVSVLFLELGLFEVR